MSSVAGPNQLLRRTCVLVVVLGLAVFGPPAAAAGTPLFQQQGEGGGAVGDTSERGSAFTVPEGSRWTIEEASMPGGAPGSGRFTLSIYEDDGGKPGTRLYHAPGLTPEVGPLPSGDGAVDKLYRLTLPTPPTLQRGTYWLALVADFWWSANMPPVSALKSAERGADGEWSIRHQWDYNFALHGRESAVDVTPPVITPQLSPTSPDGDNGWYRSDVGVSWSVLDGESLISSSSGCGPTSLSADTAGTVLTCTATSEGGTGSESVTVRRDATPPDVSWTGAIHHGDSFYFGAVPSKPTCAATDALAGPAGCTVSGYSPATGTHTMTATALDEAGNSAEQTRTYTVRPWTLAGFHQPVTMGRANTVRAGSTVPLKFEVFVGPTELTDTGAVQAFTQSIDCATSGGEGIERYASGGTSLRYDGIEGRFVFNWHTPRTPGACYRVTMTTQDGSAIAADFRLK